tara:strand:- start:250836 stop:251126 length:291 start_codon:yes stop_codon:yes gene_type:complete
MSTNPSNRTIDDLPKPLVDHFKPRLTDAFNTVAEQSKRIEQDPQLAQDADFLTQISDTIEDIQTLAQEFMLASGGDEEGFMILVEEATQGLFPPQP